MANHNAERLSSRNSGSERSNSNLWHLLTPCINVIRLFDIRSPITLIAWNKQRPESDDVLPPGITLVASFGSYAGELNFLTTSSDGFLYAGCNCSHVSVWNKAELFGGFITRSMSVTDIVVGPQGQVISSHCDGTIKVWKINYGKSHGKSPSYYQVANLPTRADQIINMFRRLNYNSQSLYKHDTPISCLCLSQDMRFVYSGSWDHTVKMWRLKDWRLVESIKGHTQKVNAIATGSDGLMFSGSTDGSIRMFRRVKGWRKDAPKHKFVCALLSEGIVVRALLSKFSEDGTCQLFAGLDDGTLRFWQQKSGWRHPMTLSYHKKAVTCVAGLSGSLVFSGSLDGKICAWSAERYNHKPLMVLTPHQGSVTCLAVQEDWEENFDGPCRFILYSAGQDSSIKIWRIAHVDDNNQCLT